MEVVSGDGGQRIKSGQMKQENRYKRETKKQERKKMTVFRSRNFCPFASDSFCSPFSPSRFTDKQRVKMDLAYKNVQERNEKKRKKEVTRHPILCDEPRANARREKKKKKTLEKSLHPWSGVPARIVI